MQDTFGTSLKKLDWIRRRKNRMLAILILLSLIVMLDVFWVLRQPGLTLAGDATCGITEHTHSETCYAEDDSCMQEEHVHSITCYSDDAADVETPLDWQQMFADYPYTGNLRRDLVGIAQTQVGYTESERNFEVDENKNRHGYTRYGAWYSAPYADWSAMFVSFCLSYAGADSDENPGNIGANSMAESWDALGKYVEVNEYTPVEGDLIFFNDNTVGIVTTVQSNMFSAICGDIDDKVSKVTMSLYDSSIAGWGITEGKVSGKENHILNAQVSQSDLLDISNGPAVFIFVENKTEQKVGRFSSKASREITDLNAYLQQYGGEYSFTLLDTNNQELPKDEDNNYIVESGTNYKLTLMLSSANGFHPGTYQYQLPNGLQVNGGNGNFILQDQTDVGTWVVTDQGLITMVFNENMNTHSEVTISATMGIKFPEQEEPLDFDGKITVTIEKPSQDGTKLEKWGKQGGQGDQTQPDPSKVYWTVKIMGNEGSHIPGSIATDQVLYGDHNYTKSDIEGGLTFTVAEPNPNPGQDPIWHTWKVSSDDPKLNWTETEWSYQIPETVTCEHCGQLQLGSNKWEYYIRYTSTPTEDTGISDHMNRVIVDGQQTEGWSEFQHTEAQAEVFKHGVFQGDADGGTFLWEVKATIPGLKPGEKAENAWYLLDILRIRNADGIVGAVKNDLHLGTITATNNGTTVTVPYILDTSDENQFAWADPWTEQGNASVDLLCRCNCTEESCNNWENGACKNQHWSNRGFCHCWTMTGDTTFTFSYETDDISLVEEYGGTGSELLNVAELYNRPGWQSGVKVSEAESVVSIPGIFKKELTHDYNGYTANYEITVNEAKLALTNGTPLTIHDVMTQTLAYISGSLVIRTEDANGKKGTLQQGTDYTVTYDGTGNVKDENGNPVHTMDIVILNPQPVMYVLDYDATLIIPPGTTQAVKYSNSATITLWGQDITDSSAEKVHADINIAAKRYQVEMHKTDAHTGEPLPGATFGLFNTKGGLIASDVTDARGELLFQTNVVEGIILREHVLYYMQELEAPTGYMLDDKKYWFCFCNNGGDACETCDEVMAGTDAFRIPHEKIGKAEAENIPADYDLPATGGPGHYPLMMTSGLLIFTVLLYRLVRRRQRKGGSKS